MMDFNINADLFHVLLKSSNKPTSTVIPEGSWTCKKCGNLNYPFRNVCNRKDCRTDKTVSV